MERHFDQELKDLKQEIFTAPRDKRTEDYITGRYG